MKKMDVPDAVAYSEVARRRRDEERQRRIKRVNPGKPVLRAKAQPLSLNKVASTSIRELIEHMRETLRDAPGVGFAAPQIGESLERAVIEDKAEYQAGLDNYNRFS